MLLVKMKCKVAIILIKTYDNNCCKTSTRYFPKSFFSSFPS